MRILIGEEEVSSNSTTCFPFYFLCNCIICFGISAVLKGTSWKALSDIIIIENSAACYFKLIGLIILIIEVIPNYLHLICTTEIRKQTGLLRWMQLN